MRYTGMKNKQVALIKQVSKPKTTPASSYYEEEEYDQEKHLPFFTEAYQLHKITVPLDGPVREASYYRNIHQRLACCTENDEVEFTINSVGGNLFGLVSLLEAIRTTPAQVKANIVGECHSAASILALNCPVVSVSPYASMLVHSMSYGSAGKAADIRGHVMHSSRYAEELLRETYEHFLTEQEISEVLEGREIWMNAQEIEQRLKHRQDVYEQADQGIEAAIQADVDYNYDSGYTDAELDECFLDELPIDAELQFEDTAQMVSDQDDDFVEVTQASFQTAGSKPTNTEGVVLKPKKQKTDLSKLTKLFEPEQPK